jgi:hypothetical protein
MELMKMGRAADSAPELLYAGMMALMLLESPPA